MNQLFLDILYPVCCSNCHATIRQNILTLCRSCLKQLSEASEAGVRQVVDSYGVDETGIEPCAAFALWYYDLMSPARVLQRRLKYGGHRRLAVQLGRLLGQKILEYQSRAAFFDVIVPIPLHRIRLLERGYNQACEVARGTSDIINAPLDTRSLLKKYISQSQVLSDRSEREINLREAFSLASEHGLSGKNVLLIDDVATTGATLRSAIKTLSRAGISRIGIAVLFVVPVDAA